MHENLSRTQVGQDYWLIMQRQYESLVSVLSWERTCLLERQAVAKIIIISGNWPAACSLAYIAFVHFCSNLI